MAHADHPYFDIPKTTAPLGREVVDPVHLDLSDLASLSHARRFIASVVRIFGGPNCRIIGFADRFRATPYAANGEGRDLIDATAGLHSLIALTVEELRKNAKKTVPLPFKQAVTNVSVAKMLETISTPNENCRTPLYVDHLGETKLPWLPPQHFIGASVDRDQSRTGTFEISGISFDRRLGVLARLDDGEIEVRLTAKLEEDLSGLPISSLRNNLWLMGTIVLSDGYWVVEEGAKVTSQMGIR